MTKLSLDIIESYGFPNRRYKPDHDDISMDIELPNGLTLTTSIVLGYDVVKSDSLEGLDGWIFIETKEELDALIALTYEEILDKLAAKDEDFNKNVFL